MSGKKQSQRQESEIAEIKRQWLAEAEQYLNNPPQENTSLDGADSTMLAQIQIKYMKRIKEVLEASE